MKSFNREKSVKIGMVYLLRIKPIDTCIICIVSLLVYYYTTSNSIIEKINVILKK